MLHFSTVFGLNIKFNGLWNSINTIRFFEVAIYCNEKGVNKIIMFERLIFKILFFSCDRCEKRFWWICSGVSIQRIWSAVFQIYLMYYVCVEFHDTRFLRCYFSQLKFKRTKKIDVHYDKYNKSLFQSSLSS